jgi:DNA-binding MarR family transcriptional regulator
MATETTFTPQVLGETEKALNAILYRQLAATGLTEHQWITLRLTVTGGGDADREQLVGRLAGALKGPAADAQARVDELVDQGLVASGGEPPRVTATDAGNRLHGQIRAGISDITERLWGDLSSADLDTTGRTLATILQRANAYFAA